MFVVFLMFYSWKGKKLFEFSTMCSKLFHHILIFLVVFLPAIAAAYEGYIEKMTFDAELKQYKTAKHMFELAISKRNEIKQEVKKKVIKLKRKVLL